MQEKEATGLSFTRATSSECDSSNCPACPPHSRGLDAEFTISSEDLSTQVTKASNVALDPRGQESLRAGGKGNGLILVRNTMTGRTRWDPTLVERSDFRESWLYTQHRGSHSLRVQKGHWKTRPQPLRATLATVCPGLPSVLVLM